MRNWLVIALTATLTMGWSVDAEAGKKDKGTEAAETEGAGLEIVETGLADVDSFFAAAKAPIDTISNTKNVVNRINTDLATALGLAEGTPLADAMADLKTKAEGKVSVAMDGAMPKLEASDGVPENVSNAVGALNSALAELGQVISGLEALPEQFATLVAEAQKFTDPNTLKGMVSNPLLATKAVPKISKNIKALGDAKTEAEELVKSITLLKKTITTLNG